MQLLPEPSTDHTDRLPTTARVHRPVSAVSGPGTDTLHTTMLGAKLQLAAVVQSLLAEEIVPAALAGTSYVLALY